jgi:hypothetical protein
MGVRDAELYARASSVGPVALVNGHLTGDTTPDTQVCLP